MIIYKERRVSLGTREPLTPCFPLRRHTFVAYKLHFTGLLRDNETICLVVQEKPLFTGHTTLSMSEDCIVINTFQKSLPSVCKLFRWKLYMSLCVVLRKFLSLLISNIVRCSFLKCKQLFFMLTSDRNSQVNKLMAYTMVNAALPLYLSLEALWPDSECWMGLLPLAHWWNYP